MERREKNKLPEFQSLEEEKEYWEARGPFAEGRKGRINKPKADHKRSSFLTIRLSGEELTLLRDMAVKVGLAPSTYARLAIMAGIQEQILLSSSVSAESRNLVEELRFRHTSRPFHYRYDNALRGATDAMSIQWPPDKSHDELAEKAYSAYMKSVQELEKTYNDIRKKAYDACDKVKEGDPSALQVMLNAIFECLWATLICQQSAERQEIQRAANRAFTATSTVHSEK